MKVCVSQEADEIAAWCEENICQKWYVPLQAYHPSWCQWPFRFWTQDGKYKQWSWYATNRGC